MATLALSSLKNPLEALPYFSKTESEEKMEYLIKTVACVAAGAFFIPHFITGLSAGVTILCQSVALGIIFHVLGVVDMEKNSKYFESIKKHAFVAAIGAPILEEIIFRGTLIPIITDVSQKILPFTAAALTGPGASILGPGLSIASAVAIVLSSVGFGVAHLTNDHKNAGVQSLFCAISGIAFGRLYQTFGLGASIGAHIANNAIIVSYVKLFASEKK